MPAVQKQSHICFGFLCDSAVLFPKSIATREDSKNKTINLETQRDEAATKAKSKHKP